MRQQEGYYHIVLTEADEGIDLAAIDEQKRRLCAAFRDFMVRRGWAYEMLICPSFVKVTASGQRRKAHPHIHILLHAQACSSAAQFICDYWQGNRGRGQRIGQANKYLCSSYAHHLRDEYLPNQAEGGRLWQQAYNADTLESSEAIIDDIHAVEEARQSAVPAASATPLRSAQNIVFLINNIGAYMGEQREADGPPSPACYPVPHAHEGPGAGAEGRADGQRHPSGSARPSGARRGYGLGIWGQPTVQMRQQNGKERGWGRRDAQQYNTEQCALRAMDAAAEDYRIANHGAAPMPSG